MQASTRRNNNGLFHPEDNRKRIRDDFQTTGSHLHVINLLICGLLISCGPSPKEQATTSATLMATVDMGWTIPANFSTYTDDSGIFSISLPSDWEVDLSDLTDWSSFKESINSEVTEINLDEVIIVFFAGVPCGPDCIHPSCTITIGPLPPLIQSLEAIVSMNVRTAKDMAERYSEISREITIIDDREVVILETEMSLHTGNFRNFHHLTLVTKEDGISWVMSCGVATALADYSEYEGDFHDIVRSLQIHE